MTESSLSLSYRSFQSRIGFFLGYGQDYTLWETEKVTLVDKCIQDGLNKFYNPPLVQGMNERYSWKFLTLPGTFKTIAPYSTGTVTNTGAVIALSGGTFPLWAATNGVFVVNNTQYSISTRDSNSQITLTEAPEEDFSGSAFVLNHNGNYDMPDDWNGWKSNHLTFGLDEYGKIIFCSEGSIRLLRQNDTHGLPSKAAWRAKPGVTTTRGQRFELMLWPLPDAEYTIEGMYNVLQNQIDPTTNPFPMGGSSHGRTILEAMLSEAEINVNDTAGLHSSLFEQFLMASIAEDMGKEPDYYGYNGQGESRSSGSGRKTYVTYEGIFYDGK